MNSAMQSALHHFRSHPVLRTQDALTLGIHPRTLYALRDEGQIEQLSRGLFALADGPTLAHPDLVIVAQKVPQAVIALISAAAFHDLTTQIPHAVHIALPAFRHPPSLDFPPLAVYRVSEPAYSAGVEEQMLDGVPVPIYSPEKTVADLFKFRNRVGLDVALETLKRYLARRDRNMEHLFHFAHICRVAGVLRPYVEALV
jgi:predicted transcriptional regulator of viral defense system